MDQRDWRSWQVQTRSHFSGFTRGSFRKTLGASNIYVLTPSRYWPLSLRPTKMWMCLTTLQFGFMSPCKHWVVPSDPMFQPREYLTFLSMVCTFPCWWICLHYCLSYITYPHVYPEIPTILKPSSHVTISSKPFHVLVTNIFILIYASIISFPPYHMTFHILYYMTVNFLHIFLHTKL